MTRALAQDALRYVSREYRDKGAQYRKMSKRHGTWEWMAAYSIADTIYHTYHQTECMAALQSRIEKALTPDVQ